MPSRRAEGSDPQRRFVFGSALFLALLDPLAAQQQLAAGRLADLSLEELGNIRITSVSKRAERLADAPAAVFVLTAEDIRRSGATTLPEVLRLAPNLHIARVSSPGVVVSARGFSSQSANKLLVLIDGRSVYTPFFSGVFWDVQDPMLEDIERIEVISGPGGTLWGANAVNGVINIITKSAADTQGGLLAPGAGTHEAQFALRYGGALGAGGHYRAYAKYQNLDHSETAAGLAKDDALERMRLGFRADWALDAGSLSVSGNAYRGLEGQPPPGTIQTNQPFALGDITLSGANLLARWERPLDGGAGLSVQAYYDRTYRNVVPSFGETLEIVDLQWQHSSAPGERHAFVWGGGLRRSHDRLANSVYIAFLPARLNQTWSNLFAQYDATLREDLKLTLGARAERNDYTGTEFLPNLRLAWKPSAEHLLWTALSRTVRAPSRLDHDIYVPGVPPYLLAGGPDVRSETAKVIELGWRAQPSAQLSYSVTLFHADYDHLRTQAIAPSGTYLIFANGMEGRARGLEAWGQWQAAPRWRLSAGATTLHRSLWMKPGQVDTSNALLTVGQDPRSKWLLRSALELSDTRELDATLRRVAALTNPDVPAYTALDLRYAWQPRPDLELSVAGRNLFSGGHGEFAGIGTRSEWGPSLFFKIVSRF